MSNQVPDAVYRDGDEELPVLGLKTLVADITSLGDGAKQLMIKERKALILKKLDLSSLEEWSPENARAAKELIQEFHYVFSLDKLIWAGPATHDIKLTDYKPFKEQYHRIPPHQLEEVRKHLQEMLDTGAIRCLQSAWCSAVVLVWKKNRELHFCIGLHQLNASLHQLNARAKDAYTLLCIDEAMDYLAGSHHFSSLNLKSGYWQVEMEESAKKYTTFMVGLLGFFECERMPFGLSNALVTFQQLMENCLGELNLTWCLIYLDNMVVFSKTEEDHLTHFRAVFEHLAKADLHLKPMKCELFQKQITYMGHLVSEEGIQPNLKGIKAVKNWPQPTTVTKVRQFLGFVNHYHQFIKGYSKITWLLTPLMAGENAKLKNTLVSWTSECEAAFQDLKEACRLHAPIHPDHRCVL